PHETGGRNLAAISRLKRRVRRFPSAIHPRRVERTWESRRKSIACALGCGMAPDLEFRKARPADLPRLHDIRIAAFTPVHDGFREQIGEKMFQIHYHDWKEKQGAHLDEICASPEANRWVYVALEGNEIVGFIGFSFDAARRSGE